MVFLGTILFIFQSTAARLRLIVSDGQQPIFYRYAFYFSDGKAATPKYVTNYYHIDHMSAYQEAVEKRPDRSFYSLTLWKIENDFTKIDKKSCFQFDFNKTMGG